MVECTSRGVIWHGDPIIILVPQDLAAERTTCNARIDEEKKTLALRIKDAEVKAQQASTEQAVRLARQHA